MNEDIKVSEIQASLILAQDRKYTRIAEAHLAAMNARDLGAIGQSLAADVHFVGPAGEALDRSSFLQTYEKVFQHLESLEVLAQSRLKDQSTSIYNLIFPSGQVKTTLVMTHEETEGLIKKVEMICDAAMLQNHLNPQK